MKMMETFSCIGMVCMFAYVSGTLPISALCTNASSPRVTLPNVNSPHPLPHPHSISTTVVPTDISSGEHAEEKEIFI